VTKFNITLSESDHTRAKIISVLKGMPLNEYIEHAIEHALQDDQALLDNLQAMLDNLQHKVL
jgi:hypothetical protein